MLGPAIARSLQRRSFYHRLHRTDNGDRRTLDSGPNRPAVCSAIIQSTRQEVHAMSPERTQAYKRVMRTLTEIGPSKLLADEQERVRDAADTLIFSSGLSDEQAAIDALADADELCRDLVASGRWERVTAARLAQDLRGCGARAEAEAALRAA
jgi:hypothetical protein